MADAAPIRVAVVNDYEVVVEGVAAMLERFSDRLVVVELGCQVDVISEVDIALFDAFTMEGTDIPALETLVANPIVGRTVLYTWNLVLEQTKLALERGADGVLAKTLAPDELVAALESIHDGHPVISVDPGPDAVISSGQWPGQAEGLTARESEIVALIVQGLSNAEVAQRTFLSVNSVKTYIRSAYRTMGVQTRSRAILWGIEHGMEPFPSRILRDVSAPTTGATEQLA